MDETARVRAENEILRRFVEKLAVSAKDPHEPLRWLGMRAAQLLRNLKQRELDAEEFANGPYGPRISERKSRVG